MDNDLHDLMETPDLHQLLQEDDTATHTGHAHKVAMEIQSRCQLLELSVQRSSSQVDDLVGSLRDNMDQQTDDIISGLEGLEGWLQGAYDLIALEPSRHLYPPSLVSDDISRPFSQTSVYTEGGEVENRDLYEQTPSPAQNGSGKEDEVNKEEMEEEAGNKEEENEEEGGGEMIEEEVINHDAPTDPSSSSGGEGSGGVNGSGADASEEELSSSQTDTTTVTSGDTGEESSCVSKVELEALGWVRGIHVLPMHHAVPAVLAALPPPTSPSGSSTSSSTFSSLVMPGAEEVDLDSLLLDLEVCVA